jgi:hypothetical protein
MRTASRASTGASQAPARASTPIFFLNRPSSCPVGDGGPSSAKIAAGHLGSRPATEMHESRDGRPFVAAINQPAAARGLLKWRRRMEEQADCEIRGQESGSKEGGPMAVRGRASPSCFAETQPRRLARPPSASRPQVGLAAAAPEWRRGGMGELRRRSRPGCSRCRCRCRRRYRRGRGCWRRAGGCAAYRVGHSFSTLARLPSLFVESSTQPHGMAGASRQRQTRLSSPTRPHSPAHPAPQTAGPGARAKGEHQGFPSRRRGSNQLVLLASGDRPGKGGEQWGLSRQPGSRHATGRRGVPAQPVRLAATSGSHHRISSTCPGQDRRFTILAP